MEPIQIGKIMEKQQVQVSESQKAQEPKTSLQTYRPKLPPTSTPEGMVLKLKYQSKQIGQMTEAEVSLWGKSLLLKIHVITGWVIPATELMTILVDQFQKKLIESYPNMNPEEIEYCFRNGGTTVKDWGKAMNLALIDEVLIPYLAERQRLSHELEERSVPPPEQVVNTDEELMNYWRMWTEEFYQRLRKGQVEKVPNYTREILVIDGMIKKPGEADSFFASKLGNGKENIYKCETTG